MCNVNAKVGNERHFEQKGIFFEQKDNFTHEI